MSGKRIAKSSVDWAKISTLFSKAEQSEFLKLKGKSDSCMRKVIQNPEKAPEINFNAIKAQVSDKSAIETLEKAYKSLSVAYPGDNNVSQQIATQERDHKTRGQQLIGKIKEESKEANELLEKFDKMIPYDQMHPEEFTLTFPDWTTSPQNKLILVHSQRPPGLSKKQWNEIDKQL